MVVKICEGCLENDLQNNFITYRDMNFHNICIDKQPPNSVYLYLDASGNIESWIKDNICAIVWHPERMSMPFIPNEIREVTGL